ncbi:FkbM family methyltransferase [Hyalangium rubrum]|uniref:FkbM family methyltransferase n=1 Tax=Hyalangium rubrum TaxID=3103134 RepID=A0ABU5HEE9_9BACT|nr:FkbM family methyltransferase [Hyalangium sp. s54d21]MDY7231842.1 FkbM family methyltransferase [Hyalangium sp. s54d21]
MKRTIVRVVGHVARRVYPLQSRFELARRVHQRLVRHFSYSRKPLWVDYDGVTFEVMLGDNLQRHLFFSGSYEPELHEVLKGELRGGGVMVDVGANIGIHCLPVARMLQNGGEGRVYAFEPAPDTAERLRRMAERNGVSTRLEVVQVALGDKPRTASLRSATDHASLDVGMRSLYGSGGDAIPVEVTTFDAWAQGAGLTRWDVLKMDVEGAETEVLRGMQHTLKTLRPRLLAIEVVDEHLRRAGSSRDELVELLRSVGYRELAPSETLHGVTASVVAPNTFFRPA